MTQKATIELHKHTVPNSRGKIENTIDCLPEIDGFVIGDAVLQADL